MLSPISVDAGFDSTVVGGSGCRGWLGLLGLPGVEGVARVAGVAGGGSSCRLLSSKPREMPVKPVLSGFSTERFQDRFDTFDSFSLAEAPVCKKFFPSLWSWRIF